MIDGQIDKHWYRCRWNFILVDLYVSWYTHNVQEGKRTKYLQVYIYFSTVTECIGFIVAILLHPCSIFNTLIQCGSVSMWQDEDKKYLEMEELLLSVVWLLPKKNLE